MNQKDLLRTPKKPAFSNFIAPIGLNNNDKSLLGELTMKKESVEELDMIR